MSTRLFVGNLEFKADVDDVREHFASVGEVVDVHICRDKETSRPRGFCFVTMESEEAADEAIIKLHGTKILGREIRVDFAQDKPTRNR